MDGVTTISYLLGIRGTIVFSAAVFLIFLAAIAAFGWYGFEVNWVIVLVLILTGPAAMNLLTWGRKVWANASEANFRNAMRMSIIGSVCMNVLFGVLLLLAIFDILA